MNAQKNKLFLSSELTATPGVESRSSFPVESDYLVRIMTDETSSLRSYVANTSDVQERLYKWASAISQDVDQLKSVVQWQHRVIDYNSVYQAFLMDQLTEDEFEAEAEKFSYEAVSMLPEELAVKVRRLYQLSGIHYTPSDISDLFQCNHNEAMRAISLIRDASPDISYMLPEADR